MNKKIGVIGGGMAGLHMALYVQKHDPDIDITIFGDRDPKQFRGSQLLNTVAHHSVTLDRETELGVNHWSVEDYGYYGHHYYLATGKEPIRFYGDYQLPSRAVDYRLYHPRLIEDFQERGGDYIIKRVEQSDIKQLSSEFDLLVVCTGKGHFGEMFEYDRRYMPFDRPARLLCAGLYKGVAQRERRAVTMNFIPHVGELIEIPTLTFDNKMAAALLFEACPGSELEAAYATKYAEDPANFRRTILGLIEKYFPDMRERIDTQEFDLVSGSATDCLQGGVVPSARKSHVVLNNGTIAVSLGDVTVTVDPLLGQGANIASHSAVVLGKYIIAEDVYDERFAEKVWLAGSDRPVSALQWTTSIIKNLNEMPAGFMEWMKTTSESRKLADEFTNNFNYPERQWDCFSSEARMKNWAEKTLRSGLREDELMHRVAVTG